MATAMTDEARQTEVRARHDRFRLPDGSFPPIAGADDRPTTVEELEARQTEIQGRLEDLHGEHAGRAFPEDARNEWAALNEERDNNTRLIDELNVRRSRIAENADNAENRESTATTFNTARPGATRGGDIFDLTTVRSSVSNPDEARREMTDRAKRAIATAHFPHERANREECQTHVEHLLDYGVQERGMKGEFARHLLVTGSPTYSRAFGKALKGAPLSNDEQRALSLAGAGGGFAVPFALDPTIIRTSNASVNPWRAISRVESISGANTWQGVSSAGVTATRVAEGTEATDNAPTLAQPQATVTKAHAFIPFSIEVDQDWDALQTEMAGLIQDAKDDEEAASFATGVGTTVFPQGVVTGTTNTVAASTGLTVTAANVYALEAALPPRFRPNETFVANRSVYNVIRNIDTAGGAALWLYIGDGLRNNGVRGGGNTGAQLLGAPAYESSSMVGTIANAAKIAVVGDFRYFLIVDRIGLTVEVAPMLFGATNRFPTGQRGIYAYWRNTSKVLDANAFRALTGTT